MKKSNVLATAFIILVVILTIIFLIYISPVIPFLWNFVAGLAGANESRYF